MRFRNLRRSERPLGRAITGAAGSTEAPSALSASVVALVGTMIKLANNELSFDDLLERLGSFLTGPGAPTDAPLLVKRLLTTVYQSTKNSGKVTRDAARDDSQPVLDLGCIEIKLFQSVARQRQ